jgi:hypothetical protein
MRHNAAIWRPAIDINGIATGAITIAIVSAARSIVRRRRH